jgi:FkbM family methyltransferase
LVDDAATRMEWQTFCNPAIRPSLMNILNKLKSRLSSQAPDQPAASAAPHRERHVLTDIGGRRYRIESDDNYLDHIRGAFEPQMVTLFDALLQPEDTVLDIGANIGCTAILFGSRSRRVLGFEPSPSTYAFLRKNIAASGLTNVAAYNVGLGKTAGRFELTFAADNRSGGFVSDKMQASTGHQVEAIEIAQGDAFLRDAGIEHVDFVKIDVEGFERDVIEGLAQTLAASRPAVTLELNHWCLNVFQRTSVPDFFDFLRAVFPCLYAVGTHDIRDLHDADHAWSADSNTRTSWVRFSRRGWPRSAPGSAAASNDASRPKASRYVNATMSPILAGFLTWRHAGCTTISA